MEKKLYDLTNPQKLIWYTEQFCSNTSINNITGTVIINEVIDVDALKKAINLFVQKNDAMRIQITLDSLLKAKQYVTNYIPFDIDIFNVKSEADLKKKSSLLASQPFKIIDSPLINFKIFKFSNGTGGFIGIAHHLILDSWSGCSLGNEILSHYYDLTHNIPIDTSQNNSYIDFIDSQNNYINSEKFNTDKKYWEEKYSDSIPEIASFCPNYKNVSHDYRAIRKEFQLPSNLANKINTFCTEHRISLFNLFLGMYCIYLNKTTNLDNIVFGSPILNRKNIKEKETMGMFINTLPFNIIVENSIKFSDFIKNISVQELNIFRHQKYPYMHLLKYIRKKFNTSESLYNFILSYQNSNIGFDKNKIDYSRIWSFNGYILEPLNIHICDMDDNKVSVYYDYQIQAFSEKEITVLHNHILNMLEQVLENPDIIIKNIDILTKPEINHILYDFNKPEAKYPDKENIVSLFEKQVLLTPNNIAITYEGKTLTYKELNNKANQLAHYLKENGITNNSIVALRLNKSLEMIIGILAIIKAGACYLPINLSYPHDRINFMLKDSNAKILLTNNDSKDESIEIDTLLIDLDNSNIYNNENIENLDTKISPDDLLYIIYTSGSTGNPKGVMITHRNVVRLMKNDNFDFDFTPNDVWTMFHSVAFDFSVWEMYGALLYGGKLVLVPENTSKNPYEFLDLLRKEKVTVLNQTPTYFYNLLDAELKREDSDLVIRYIIFGGEALNPTLIKNWSKKYNFTKLINMYGITETTVHVTFKELNQHDMEKPSSNIGVPIPTLKVYIMNNDLNLLPYNVEGQICVAGPGICKGYLNRDDLNKQKFIENPYIPGEKIYLSGDSGYLSEDGNLYYKGRMDNQLKLRGFRVELGEIEEKLLSHPLISKCVVLPKKNNDKDVQLIAFIVSPAKLTPRDLKQFLQDKLPEYMIPNIFAFVDKIPLNHNGKTDRKALLAKKLNIDVTENYAPPRNNFERTLKNILEESLNIYNISIDDDILEIGADSLTLMKVSIDLLEKNYKVNIQDFYEYKTIRNINDNMKSKHPLHKVLKENIYYNFDNDFSDEKVTMENILLTGATGYLGVHILYDLIKNTNTNIYCLIRDKNNIDAIDRIINKYKFYFNEDITPLLNKRVFVIKGNIINKNLNIPLNKYNKLGHKIDTVIHSAARVDHYGDSETFNRINIDGTNHVLEFCKKFKTRLNYISTISVSGNNIPNIDHVEIFDESSLYIGQNYEDNIYIKTKFEAEYNVYKAMQKGLEVCVYRLGNIMARFSDGQFQENYKQNAFYNRLDSFIQLGKFPESLSNLEVDFSPVDLCAKIIVNFSLYKSSYNKVFHILNNNKLKFGEILEYFNKLGYHIDIIPDDEFYRFLKKTNNKDNILGIINDITSDIITDDSNISISSDFTINCMKTINMSWPKIDDNYFRKFYDKINRR